MEESQEPLEDKSLAAGPGGDAFANGGVDDVPAEDEVDDEEHGLSLEELSRSYSRALGGEAAAAATHGGETSGNAAEPDDSPQLGLFDPLATELSSSELCPLSPRSILEAILFVGQADSRATTAAEIAGLMRGVEEAEIESLVDELNAIYEQTGRATRIVAAGAGFRLQVADELAFIKERFYGRVREVRLNQAAIDCLALVAYQPGISREKLEEQRGQPSGGVLNQLVRREMLEMRRQPAGKGKKFSQHYYPTDRLLELTGLGSLEDLPQAEDF